MHNKLPKIYHFINDLNIPEVLKLNNKIALIYRNYEKIPSDNEIITFKRFCKSKKRRFIISKYYDLVIKHDLDGFYIPSFDKNINFKILNKNKKFIVIGSAHNYKEIKCKIRQGVQQIFVSPLFKVKKSNNSLGLNKFIKLKLYSKIPIIALGGLNAKNYKYANLSLPNGYATLNSVNDFNINTRLLYEA